MGRILTIIVLALAGITAGLVWAGLRISPLATHSWDKQAAIEAAAGYDVEIVRDGWGVPHILGKRDADAAFGAAFAHAEDDFPMIETAIHAARGADTVARSQAEAIQAYLVQLFGVKDLVAERYELDISPEARSMVEGYVAGLNYYAALNPDEVSTTLFPVQPEDLIHLVTFSSPLFYGMSDTLTKLISPERDREAGRGQELQVNLFGIPDGTELGSNGLAVAPPRSPDGVTRLFVNSHQPTDGPLAWYEIRMKSDEGLDFAGGTFPGSPLPFHGHNADMGWTSTINRPDLIDVFELTVNPENEGQYRLDGAWVEFERGTAEMTVQLWGPFAWRVTRETLRSAHGPVLKTDRGAFAIRYATMDTVGFFEEQFRLVKARTLEEFRDALRLNTQGNANRIYADKAGNLAMFYVARMPRRVPGVDYSGMVPGDRSDLIWSDFVAFDDLPHTINPPEGFITEANSTPFIVTGGPSDPKPEDYPPEHGIEMRMTNRALRAIDLFANDPEITREDLITYKFDHAYDRESDVKKVMDEVLALDLSDDQTLSMAQAILSDWNLSADRDNERAALGILTALSVVLDRDKGKSPDVRTAFAEVAAHLITHFGKLTPRWGDVNRLRRGDVDVALNGGPDTLRAVYGAPDEDGRMRMVAGDGLIMLAEWAPDGTLTSRSVHHYGSAMGRPASPHYDDQSPLFADERMKPVPFSMEALDAAARERYRPGERSAAQ